MKRLLFLIPLLTTLLHATPDTITSGSIGLLKPSTTTADPTRGAGDKLNGNFDMIAATITNIYSLTSIITNSTTTLYNLLTSTSVSVSNFQNAANSTMTAISASTSTLGITVSKLPIVGIDEGTPLGGTQISAINCVGAGIACTQSGSTLTATVTATGGGGSFYGSTQTMCFRIPSAYLSTITVAGFPGAYHSWGPSTATIIGAWGYSQSASTVGWVRFDMLVSTGGVNGLPLAPNRWNPLSLSTASASGVSGYTGYYSSAVKINAFETFGIAISSIAAAGNPATGNEFCIDWWELGRY